MIKTSVVRTWRIALATLLLLAAGNALALGLGQIEVKSRINEPLLAEIPIVSTTPGELQALKARLASPDTFRRVGLQPPQGIAADLRFSLGSDARGRPVIRVTTVAPVNQAVLNFLIEVDWGQGRLVREYSALVDVPRTASAPLQPAISAPTRGRAERGPATCCVDAGCCTGHAADQHHGAAADPRDSCSTSCHGTGTCPRYCSRSRWLRPNPHRFRAAITPPPRPQQPAVRTPARAVVAAAPVPAPEARSSQYGPIKAGETLSNIASSLDRSSAYSLEQTMLALLRANPDAFLNDNINLLRQGAVLRVPGSEDRAASAPMKRSLSCANRCGSGGRPDGRSFSRMQSSLAMCPSAAPLRASRKSALQRNLPPPGPRRRQNPLQLPLQHRWPSQSPQRRRNRRRRDLQSCRRRYLARPRAHDPAPMPEARARCSNNNCSNAMKTWPHARRRSATSRSASPNLKISSSSKTSC